MTTSIILLLYLADVVSSIGVVCALALLGSAVFFSIMTLVVMLGDGGEKFPEWTKALCIWTAVAAAVGVLTPSKTTIYASAAVYVGGEAVNTEEFRLVRQLITQELRGLVAKGEKK